MADARTSVTSRNSAAGDRLFRKVDDYWELSFDGKFVYVKDLKGMGYIADLLRSPDRPLHSMQLITAAAGILKSPPLGSAGEVLDPTAINEYRSRLEELEAELTEADRNQDQGRKEAAQEEKHQLEEQLMSATGLGGRRRKAHDDLERVRKGVSISINRAIAKIREHHIALAEHLKLQTKLGSFVCYRSDGKPWQF